MEEVIDADVQTLEEDYVIIVLDPIVYLTFNLDTKRNTMSITNQTIGLVSIFQTNIIKLIIDFITKAGLYY
jgi:hypothetical protein